MITLLLDAGNTRLKWSELNSLGQRSPVQALDYTQSVDGHLGLEALTQLLQQKPTISRLVVVHVLGVDFEQALIQVAADAKLGLHCVRSQAQGFGVKVAYTYPERLGADRFVALVAAHALYPQHACIVMDCGTGVTIDALTPAGEHLGGLILPGLQVSGQALIQRAKAPHLKQSFEQISLFAQDTAQGIGSGSVFGLVGALEGISTRMEEQLSQPVKRILTGGDAALLQTYLRGDYQVEPQLIMQGLQIIAEEL